MVLQFRGVGCYERGDYILISRSVVYGFKLARLWLFLKERITF